MRSTRAAGVAVGILAAALLVVAAVAVPLGTIGPRRPDATSPRSSLATATASTTPAPAPPTGPAAADVASPEPLPAPSPAPTPVPEIGIDVGQLAPDFELRTPEGEPVRLADFRGRPVWVNFWAPWCPSCRTEMPRLEGIYVDHQPERLMILGVGVRDSPETMRAYAGEVGVTYPIVVDGDGTVANRYRAIALPVHYWIDRDGIVRDWAFGELPPDLLGASLETILPPPSP